MYFGIDIGGSHVGIGLIDDKKIIAKKERDWKKEEKTKIEIIILETIENLIQELLLEKNITIQNIEYIGIAFPASLRNRSDWYVCEFRNTRF